MPKAVRARCALAGPRRPSKDCECKYGSIIVPLIGDEPGACPWATGGGDGRWPHGGGGFVVVVVVEE